MNTYEINARNEVIPYTSGRKCTDTRAWRDATELELQQQDQIQNLERELAAARAEIDGLNFALKQASSIYDAVTEQRDRLAVAVNAATILIAAKGRHNTMLAYEGLRKALQSLTTNADVDLPDTSAQDSASKSNSPAVSG
jgi:hypothetical protein